MSVMPLLWIAWAGLASILFALLVYRGTLTRYEEDQIFLDANCEKQEMEQTALLNRIRKLQPFVRAVTGATCVLSATIIGLYVWAAVKQIYP